MRSHSLSSQLSWELPRALLLNNYSTYGSVTDRCCGTKSPRRSPTLPRWTARFDTSVPPSLPEAINSDEESGRALWFASERDQEPGKMRQVRRNAATRNRNLRELSVTRGNRDRSIESGF